MQVRHIAHFHNSVSPTVVSFRSRPHMVPIQFSTTFERLVHAAGVTQLSSQFNGRTDPTPSFARPGPLHTYVRADLIVRTVPTNPRPWIRIANKLTWLGPLRQTSTYIKVRKSLFPNKFEPTTQRLYYCYTVKSKAVEDNLQ